MTEKVWGFNCFGVCIKLIAKDKIKEYKIQRKNRNLKRILKKKLKKIKKVLTK